MLQFKLISCFIISCALIIVAGCDQAPVTETPSAQLWTDGAWALYSIDRLNTDGSTTKGTCRIASVGKEKVDGELHHWLEIREDGTDGVTITKFLAKEKPVFSLEDGFTFWQDVKQIIIQEDMNTPERVPQQHLKRFSPYFVESSGIRRYGNVQNIDPPVRDALETKTFTVNDTAIECPGVRKTNHFTSSVNLGFLHLEDTTESFVEYYSHPDVPFGGLVSVVFRSQTISENKLKPDTPPKPPQYFENKMVLQSYGTGAESQIMGQPVDMDVMPFPFLEAARQKRS
jgi:hypothetical protein